jgi:hypothetical protein
MANTEMQMQDWVISLGPAIRYPSMLVILNGWQTQSKMLVMFCLEWIQRYCTYIIQTCTHMSYTFTYMYIICIYMVYTMFMYVCTVSWKDWWQEGGCSEGEAPAQSWDSQASQGWSGLMGNEVWLWTKHMPVRTASVHCIYVYVLVYTMLGWK